MHEVLTEITMLILMLLMLMALFLCDYKQIFLSSLSLGPRDSRERQRSLPMLSGGVTTSLYIQYRTYIRMVVFKIIITDGIQEIKALEGRLH